jgi:two-component system chemotaxis response regulator CheY
MNKATRILTVDDSRTMLDMLRVSLVRAGFNVVQAENGREGLAALETHAVDVIITDVNMPVMDGITFTKNLRQAPHLKGLPVLILTTETSREKRDEGRAAGATGWIVKPFDPEKLIQTIRKVCPAA